jgi:N-acetylglucosamine-6-sulfatase
MTMKPILFSIVLLSATFLSPCAGATSRPNVLFIVRDDIRWNAMSCAGHPARKTPNIDRLANEGVRFANMFCTTSLCSPSRGSILTVEIVLGDKTVLLPLSVSGVQ